MKPTIECLPYCGAVCNDQATTLHLLVRIHAPVVKRQQKVSLNLGLAIDRSGSMGGEPMERARQAAVHLVQTLDGDDKISAVSFDSQIDLLAACDFKANQHQLISELEALTARGGTNLFQGYLGATHQVSRGADEKRLNRVILLSDGQANEGLSDPARIEAEVAKWYNQGISTTTVGLGLGYNEDLLNGMATAGGGNFYHIQDPKEIAPLFQVELAGLSSTFGHSVTLGIESLSGVELLRVLNPVERTESGQLRLGDLMHGHPVELVLEFLVPPQTSTRSLCEFTLSWTEVQSGLRNQTRQKLSLPVVPHGQLSEFPLDQRVMASRAVQLAAACMKKATELLGSQDQEQARVGLEEGLATLDEAGHSPRLEELKGQLRQLLQKLEQGQVAEVRKQASFSSRSVSYSSIVLSGGVKQWLNLPEAERTPEKLRELMGD